MSEPRGPLVAAPGGLLTASLDDRPDSWDRAVPGIFNEIVVAAASEPGETS